MIAGDEKQVVLVVDDDEWCVFSARRLLEGMGYRVDVATDGLAAPHLVARAHDVFV